NWQRYNADKSLLGYRFRHDIGKADLPMNWVLTGYEQAQIERSAREFRDLAGAARKTATKTGAEAVRQGPFRQMPAAARAAAEQKADLFGSLYRLHEKK